MRNPKSRTSAWTVPSSLVSVLLAITLLLGTSFTASGQEPQSQTSSSQLATLCISSQPDSAQVIVNNMFVGTTPCTQTVPAAELLDVRVMLPGFRDWSVITAVAAGDTSRLSVRLERVNPTFSVMVDGPRSSVSLDGSLISLGPVLDFPTTIGAHQVAVRDDSSGRSQTVHISFTEAIRHFFVAKFGTVKPNRILGAVLAPGSLQISDGEYVKGAALFAGSVALGYLAVQSHVEHRDRLREYNTTMASYIAATTDAEATRRHEEILMRKSDLDEAYARRTTMVLLFAGCYLYNLIDGLLHHLTGDTFEIVPVREVPGIPFPSDLKGASVRVRF